MKQKCIIVFLVLFLLTPFYLHAENLNATKIPVLMYHHVLKDEEMKFCKDNPYVLPLSQFQEQMKYLKEQQFNVLTSNQLIDFYYHQKPLPDKSIMITFDDGYYSNFVYAYPVMKTYGFSAVLFTITGNITKEKTEFNPNELMYGSQEDMKTTADVFEFASHTHNMHSMVNGTPALLSKSKNEVLKDIVVSLNFEPLTTQEVFSYPYGKYNNEIIELLRQTSIKIAFSTDYGYNTIKTDPFRLKRFNISGTLSFENFKNIVHLKT